MIFVDWKVFKYKLFDGFVLCIEKYPNLQKM